MEKVLSLKINDNEQIALCMPNYKDKVNYFYEPKEALHKFDETTVIYENKDKKIILEQEAIKETLSGLKKGLKWILDKKLIIPDSVNIGEVGKAENIESYRNNQTGDYKNESMKYSNCTFFSGKDIQTYIYNDHFGEIYLEISPSCPLLYREYEEGDEFATFEDFMKNYKKYAFFHIDKKTALEWKRDVDLLYMEIDDECVLH